jgi:NAD(P)-dependent dehydrogenase (short-subunit alcohol dehydrogenase family)
MRHIAISGASRRLGAALAQRFAAQGTPLFLTARSAEALAKVAALCRMPGRRLRSSPATFGTLQALPLPYWPLMTPRQLI